MDWFNGKNRMLQEYKNTSFSAVGRLCERNSNITLTLFENVFVRVKIGYDELPNMLRHKACGDHVDP